MEKIEPLKDYVALARFAEGQQVKLWGKIYTVFCKTTLATGEPALVLQGEGKQFVLPASEFLDEVNG